MSTLLIPEYNCPFTIAFNQPSVFYYTNFKFIYKETYSSLFLTSTDKLNTFNLAMPGEVVFIFLARQTIMIILKYRSH